MNTITIVGCGWLGLPLAQRFLQLGWCVRGTTRSADKLTQSSQLGIQTHLLSLGQKIDCVDPESLFSDAVLFVNVPPGRQQQDSSYGHRMRLLAETAREHGVEQVVFVSATSIYRPGDAVDELSPLDDSPRAQAMQEGERAFSDVFKEGVTLLRLSGLVGGQRHPGRFLAGRKELPGKDSPVNLVHRDDVISAVELIVSKNAYGHCFNLSAPHHPVRGQFYPLVSRQLGLPEPEFSDVVMPNKYIVGDRICDELGFSYRHPDPVIMPFELQRQ